MLLMNWLSLSDIPDEGRKLYFEDDSKWLLLWARFALDCKASKSLITSLEVLPQQDGVYFRGRVQGQIALSCSRCLEPGLVDIDYSIDVYESFAVDPEELPRQRPIKQENGKWWFSPEQLAWEHFVLALPDKPLCRKDCLGLCSRCGENINHGLCVCVEETLDPRLAVLRNLKINRQRG